MRWAARLVLAAWLGLHAVAAATQTVSAMQFSGRSIQSSPDGEPKQARLYVGDNQVRVEHVRDGRHVVEIYDLKKRRVLFVVPGQKIYMQRDLPAEAVAGPVLESNDSNPCSAMRDGDCKKLGSESLYGRTVSRWEVTVKHQGKTLRSMHWIDDQRHMSLRDVWPDGSTTASILKGMESLDGRQTERWQRTTTTTGGDKQTTTLWYDPELQLAVREELPGGSYREIKNIRVAPQPAELFAVPAGYRRVEPENAPDPMAGAPDRPGGR
jgi:hypothetical protein